MGLVWGAPFEMLPVLDRQGVLQQNDMYVRLGGGGGQRIPPTDRVSELLKHLPYTKYAVCSFYRMDVHVHI